MCGIDVYLHTHNDTLGDFRCIRWLTNLAYKWHLVKVATIRIHVVYCIDSAFLVNKFCMFLDERYNHAAFGISVLYTRFCRENEEWIIIERLKNVLDNK